MSTNRVNEYRRRFMAGVTGLAAGAALAPGFILREAQAAELSPRALDQAADSAIRWGMLIDANRLTDGGAAMVAPR